MNILAYHGSPVKFDKFDIKKIGSANGIDAGFGFYFSSSKGDAIVYGDWIYECFLQLKGAKISNDSITLQPQVLKAILGQVSEIGNSCYYEICGITKDRLKDEKLNETGIIDEEIDSLISSLLKEFKSDTELITDIIKKSFDSNPQIMLTEILPKYSITHTIDHDTIEDDKDFHIVVYNVESINILNVVNLKEI